MTNRGLKFKNEYLLRPLKRLSRDDPVFLLPNFERLNVLCLSPSPYLPEDSRIPGTIELMGFQDIVQRAGHVSEVEVVQLHLVRFL